MKTAHFMLQGKGGVGKSLMASVLAQHRTQHHAPVLNIDTDPVNATFAGYKAIGATVLDADNTQRVHDRLLFAQHRILKVTFITLGASVIALIAALIALVVH